MTLQIPQTERRYAGAAYDPRFDNKRLDKQLGRVYEAMADGHWRTLREISDITGDPEASVSAQLRHLRKPRFGAFQVNKQHRGDPSDGLYEYQLLPPRFQRIEVQPDLFR